MEKVYEGMEKVYRKIKKIEKELLEMGARKVAEKRGKPRTMNIIIGREYQQGIIDPLDFSMDDNDPLYWFISRNFNFNNDRLIVESQGDFQDPFIERAFHSKRESLQDLILKSSVVSGIAYEEGIIPSPSLTFVIVDNSKGSLEEAMEYMKGMMSPFIIYNIES